MLKTWNIYQNDDNFMKDSNNRSKKIKQSVLLPDISKNNQKINTECEPTIKKHNRCNEPLLSSNRSTTPLTTNDYYKTSTIIKLKKNAESQAKMKKNIRRVPHDTNELALERKYIDSINDDNNSQSDYYYNPKHRSQTNLIDERGVRLGTLESKVFQMYSSPYYWYFRDKSNFSPYKRYISPPLEFPNLSPDISCIDPQANIEKKFSYENMYLKSLKDSKISRKEEIAKNYKHYADKEKNKRLEQIKRIKKKARNGLPEIKVKRKLTSAKLRNLSVSEKFIEEAKYTVYSPETHSFVPVVTSNIDIKS